MASTLPILLGGAKNGLPNMRQQGTNPLLQTLKRTSPTGASKFFDTIDIITGSKGVRQFLTNKPNPSGYDVLKQGGLLTGNGFVDVPLGIAAEIALDPTTYLTGGVGAAGKAGRAARAAGLLDDAPRMFSRAAINAGKADDLVRPIKSWGDRIRQGAESVGARASRTYKKAGIPINKLSDSDLAARPLVGRRQAMRDILPGTNRPMTLDDLIKAAPDPVKAQNNVADFLGNKNVQNVINSPVFKDIGFRVPFTPIDVGMNIKGGQHIAAGLDAFGDAARYSLPGRFIASKVDKSLLETTDDVEQLIAKRLTNTEGAKRVEATKKIQELIRGVDVDLIDLAKNADNGRYIRAAVEGNEKFLETLYENSDQFKALKNHRQFDKLIKDIKKFYSGYLDESAEAGIKSASLTDQFGNNYFSRRLDRKLYPDASKGGIKTNEASVITGDMQQRSPEFNIPGGTAMLNQLSRDLAANPELREAGKLASHIMERVKQADAVLPTRPEVPVEIPIKGKGGQNVFDPNTGKPLTQTVMQRPVYSKGSAKELAGKLLAMDEGALDKGVRLFDENPFEALEQYAMGRSKAIGRANELQEMVAQTAKPIGTGPSIKGTLDRLGMSSPVRTPLTQPISKAVKPLVQPYKGAVENVVDAINSLEGKGVIQNLDDLGNWRANPELQKRIENVAKFYDDKNQQGELFRLIGSITKNFKVWVLATPRRSVRDWYSGLFSNFITHFNVNDQLQGYSVAKRAIIEQDWEGARTLLERFPRYQRIKDAGGDVIKAAQDDLALVDMAQTGKLRDIDESGQLLDKAQPEVFSKYLGGDGNPETTFGFKFLDALSGYKSKAKLDDISSVKGFNEFRNNRSNLFSEITPFEGSFSGGLKPRTEFTNIKNPVLRTAARTAELTDKINRMGGYFAMLKGGYSPEAAAKAITEAQIDYGSLTRFERNYLQVIFPFWSYQSRIIKWGAKQMYSSPAFKNIALRGPQRIGEASTPEGEVAPSRIAERYGIPMPDLGLDPYLKPLLGEAVPNADVYLSDIDIPFVDSLNTISPVVSPEPNAFGETPLSITKTIGETSKNVAGSMLNPLAKFAVEQASGQDLFTKTPLDATRRSAATIAGRMGLREGWQESIGTVEPLVTTVAPGLNHLLSVGRKISTPTVDEGGKSPSRLQNALESAINLGAGIKVERIGPEERIRDVRQKIGNFLSQSPYSREMSIPYIPEDKMGYVSPQVLELLELDKQLQKDSRQLRDKRVGSNNPLLTP